MEMVDQVLKLAKTSASRKVQEELERLKEKHDKEMREIYRRWKKLSKGRTKRGNRQKL
jgi:acetyl-CoA carboxylase alpha subunit